MLTFKFEANLKQKIFKNGTTNDDIEINIKNI